MIKLKLHIMCYYIFSLNQKRITVQYKTLFSIISLAIFLLLQGCSETKGEKKQLISKEAPKKTVEINLIKETAYPIWIDFSGKTEAFQNVNVTSRVSGELEKIHFLNGDKIKKNQRLFTVDKTSYLTTLTHKNAILQKDIASLNLSLANVKRYTPLVEKGLATQEKLDQLVAEQKQLEASIRADKAEVKQAQLDVAYCDIKATIDGNIGKALVDIGNIINQGDKLANIVQTYSLYVNFSPSSKTVTLIKKFRSQIKPKIKVTVDTENKVSQDTIELSGQVDFIDTVSNTQTDTVDMRAIIHNDKGLLFAGTFVEIKMFLTDQIPFIAVHPNNISQNQLGSYVLVVGKDNKIQTRQIESSYSNNDLVIIKSGLSAGDRVIVSEITKLRNNQEVIPKEVANKIKY